MVILTVLMVQMTDKNDAEGSGAGDGCTNNGRTDGLVQEILIFQLNTKLYLFNTLQIHAYLPNIL